MSLKSIQFRLPDADYRTLKAETALIGESPSSQAMKLTAAWLERVRAKAAKKKEAK